MASETPDILVIGLGPAGSRAAEAAAKAGFGVVALEKRAAAGTPVQCAEFVPSMIERDVPQVGDVTEQTIARMLTFVEDDERPSETPEFRGRMIDRAGFDQMLADSAAKAGADCRYGVKVLAIDADGTVHCSGGDSFKPKVLIGADGPRSRVGGAIGSVNRDLVETRQVTVPLVLPHDATDIFLSADYRGGYGWLFPKGAVANVGLGISVDGALPEDKSTRRGLKAMLMDLLSRLATERRIGTSGWGLTGGAIPVGGRLRAIGKLGDTAVLLAGDAAGLTNPVTGAGIASAVQSGIMAGRAAADVVRGRQSALDDYEEELGDIFDAALNRALRRRREVLSHYEDGGRPDAAALEDGWIGSPRYWRPEPIEEDCTDKKVEERTQ
ncbi:MAG TPA: NAD(P)/FAD-dependent oxidoreductase [Pseudolabrys sp.]|nr:NAD(P)/FAD-dependent oxidoreductase [Pseudolabrys sp.]